jgi:predicted nucleic acid-binding protein
VGPALWDTTLASRLHPAGDALDYAIDQVAAGTPVQVAAPAVLEIAYGYKLRAVRDPRFAELLAWFTRLVASDAFTVVALDGRAAIVAGSLRGAVPHPLGKRDQRSKTMRQASWLLDIQIAATAFASGLDIATDNRRDFEALADTLATLYPDAPPMDVVAGPL